VSGDDGQDDSDGRPEFGRHALPGPFERVRRFAERMPDSRPGRLAVSALRRVALAGRRGPIDVTVFGSQRARLYPSDNRCEKRVVAGPQFWDRAERAFLDRLVRAVPPGGDFVFVDAGANVGLYTLSVRAACLAAGVRLSGVAIEPDPVNGARLMANFCASGVTEIRHIAAALGAKKGTARFASRGLRNRGEARLDPEGGIVVPVRPLLDVVTEAGHGRIDAMKMDIEGHETPVLERFFADAPAGLRPRALLLETGRDGRPDLVALVARAGYVPVLGTGLNTGFSLSPDGLREAANGQA
jgi:FkbM family methyltransferase